MRSIMLGALILTATALGAAPPREHWTAVGRHGDAAVEIDKAALHTDRGLTQVAWRIVFASPRADGGAIENHVMLVDCRLRVTAGVSTTLLGSDGRMINHRADPLRIAEQRLGTPTPGTAGERVADAACAMLR